MIEDPASDCGLGSASQVVLQGGPGEEGPIAWDNPTPLKRVFLLGVRE